MKIDSFISQHRRDFRAWLVCETCGETLLLKHGYDDNNFHRNVIPNIPCNSCGETSPADYRPLTTKYPEGKVV